MRMIKLNKAPLNRYADYVGEAHSETPTIVVMVNVEAIRCFYPRKDNLPGCRITFMDGGGFAVVESCDEITAAVRGEADPV